MSFGSRLKELRLEKNMQQADLAKLLNMTNVAVSHYERDARKPTPEILSKVATIFNVSTDYLLGISSEKTTKYYDLTEKDNQQIEQSLEKIINDLDTGLYSKDMAEYDEESRQLLINALEMGLTIAKREAKKRYTPKKYRD